MTGMERATPADAWKIMAADPIFRGVVNKLVWRPGLVGWGLATCERGLPGGSRLLGQGVGKVAGYGVSAG